MLLSYLVSISVGDAGNILIGQYLGANQPKEAINAKNVTYTLGIVIVIFNAALVLISHQWLPFLFNVRAEAIALARQAILLSSVVVICDGINVVQISIAKAW